MKKKLKVTDFDRVFKKKSLQLLDYIQTALEERRPELAKSIAVEVIKLCRLGGEEAQPSIQVLILNKMSIADRYSQRFKDGLSHLETALEFCGKFKLEAGETYVNFSAILMDMKNFLEAEKYATKAIRAISADLLASSSKQDSKLSAIAYFNCGKCHKHLENFAEAMTHFQSALGILKKAGISPDESMYKKISFEHLSCMKQLNTKKTEKNYDASSQVKKSFLSVKVSKDKKGNEPKDQPLPIKNIFNFKGQNFKLGNSKPLFPIKDRTALSASAARVKYTKGRRTSYSNSQPGIKDKDDWEEANLKFRIHNGTPGTTHRSSLMKHKDEKSGAYPGSPFEGKVKHGPNESWDEGAKDIITITNHQKESIFKTFTADKTIERNKTILVRDLQQLNRIIIRPDRKLQTYHTRQNSGSKQTEENAKLEKNSYISSHSSVINDRQTSNSDAQVEVLHSRNSSTGFFIKNSDKVPKRNTLNDEAPDLFQSENINERKHGSKTVSPSTPMKIQKKKIVSIGRSTELIEVQKSEEVAKKKAPTRALQEYSARKIQRNWKGIKYSEPLLRREVERVHRGSRFLCSSYVLLWSVRSSTAADRKQPCKVMIYLHKDAFLLAVFPLPSMQPRLLRVPKNINILDGDFSRIKLTPSPDLEPFIVPEPEVPALKPEHEDREQVTPEQPQIKSASGERNSIHNDSLEKLKEQIINGLLEDDNEPSQKDIDPKPFQKSITKINSSPVIANLVESQVIPPTKKSSFKVKQPKEKKTAPASQEIPELKVDHLPPKPQKKIEVVPANHPNPLVPQKQEAKPAPAQPKTSYPISKKYGDLNKMDDAALNKAKEASGLYLKDFLKGRTEKKKQNKTRDILFSRKCIFSHNPYLMTVYKLREKRVLFISANSLKKKEAISYFQLSQEETKMWEPKIHDLVSKLAVHNGKITWILEEEEVPMLSEEDLSRSKLNQQTSQFKPEDEELNPMLEISEDPIDLKKGPSIMMRPEDDGRLHEQIAKEGQADEGGPEDAVVELPKPQKGRSLFSFELRNGEGQACTIIGKELEDKTRIVEYYGPSEKFLGSDQTGKMTKDWIIRLLKWPVDSIRPVLGEKASFEDISKPQLWAEASDQGIF